MKEPAIQAILTGKIELLKETKGNSTKWAERENNIFFINYMFNFKFLLLKRGIGLRLLGQAYWAGHSAEPRR